MHFRKSLVAILALPSLVIGCTMGPKADVLGARPLPDEKSIVVESHDPRAKSIVTRALRESGWRVVNTNLAANSVRTTVEVSKRKEVEQITPSDSSEVVLRTINETSAKEHLRGVNARYYGEVEALVSSYCIGLTGEHAGRNPEYNPISLYIYEIESGNLAFTASVGGCSGGLKNEFKDMLRSF